MPHTERETSAHARNKLSMACVDSYMMYVVDVNADGDVIIIVSVHICYTLYW